MDWCLDLCYVFICLGGGGKFSFELKFFGGWGWFYLEFLGDYFLLRGYFLLSFFLCFVVELY